MDDTENKCAAKLVSKTSLLFGTVEYCFGPVGSLCIIRMFSVHETEYCSFLITFEIWNVVKLYSVNSCKLLCMMGLLTKYFHSISYYTRCTSVTDVVSVQEKRRGLWITHVEDNDICWLSTNICCISWETLLWRYSEKYDIYYSRLLSVVYSYMLVFLRRHRICETNNNVHFSTIEN